MQLTGFLTVTTGTVLLFIRVGVIWEWKRPITAAFMLVYLTTIALGIRSIVLVRTSEIAGPIGPYCDTTSGLSVNRWNVFMTLIMDIGLLAFLFMGLWRWSNARASSTSVWHLLWNQGLIYLTLAIVLEVPMTSFIFLNYNGFIDLFFTIPETILLSVSQTPFVFDDLKAIQTNRGHAILSLVNELHRES
ncbi:hypothetical protein PENSPDRAFT_749043 [Peniophora sp. CONT]|nr:hypothetical protein PENSPDRAFT_749043 [Peniophora sp. CONT]